ncbi:hypothetical protein CPB84DRAFT_1957752 [Gymnopilus junonius]|uniref:Uncharacterized protein n=1 Tax=Gymnopilus junonius TaxID=109634 RepID=A0A9P5P2N1_GYMJU|nr:hypothetical protein CPB84DRAFT_1957752 [Gymnopilus junonius]
MESSSTKTVALATASALGTGVYTIFRKQPHTGLLVGIAAVNSGITAATFFSCREYFISPLLLLAAPWQQYSRRRQELGIYASSLPTEAGSLSDLRTNKLLDSALSGAITGGLLRGLQASRRAVLPGMVTTGVVCTLLQYGFNELTVLRLRYISKLKEENRTAVVMPHSRPRDASQVSTESSTPVLKTLLSFLGVRPMSDEEYLAKMKRTRDAYLKRIAELELQVEVEKVSAEAPDKS